jgi:hypothetical protein
VGYGNLECMRNAKKYILSFLKGINQYLTLLLRNSQTRAIRSTHVKQNDALKWSYVIQE